MEDLNFRDLLVRALVERFGGRDLRLGTPPDPAVVFPAQHPAVGGATIWTPESAGGSIGELARARIQVGSILYDEFRSLDVHLPALDRGERVTKEVVRFFDHLLSDRLVFWKSADQRQTRGWRECHDINHREPLVLDDRTYEVYLWSGPLPRWRATTAILGRGVIREEREYQILLMRLHDPGDALHGTDGELAQRLVAEYERNQH
jgi:hypothetical protein